MRNSIFLIATAPAALAVFSIFPPAYAQGQPAADGAMGQQIATNGAPGVAACASCHGARGEGNAASNFPRIAGQGEGYLARQLIAYANGSRANPVMMPIAKAMNQQQIDAVSLYYAALDAPSLQKPGAQATDKTHARGRTLANIGDNAIGIQSCANCHGPAGIGEPPNYPYLASQFDSYLTVTLNDFKKGTRKTDASGMMNIIASQLSDADIKSVSAYYAAQPAGPPAAKRANIAAASALRPAAPGSSAPAGQQSVPVQGTGVEQGAPTTGGGQGPGGGGGASGTGPQGAPAAPSGTSGGGTGEQQIVPGGGAQGAPSAPSPSSEPSDGGPGEGQQSVPVQGVGVEQGAPTTGGGQGPGGGGGASGTGPQGTPSR